MDNSHAQTGAFQVASEPDIQRQLEANAHSLIRELDGARTLLPQQQVAVQTASDAVLEAHVRIREIDNDPNVQVAARELALAEQILLRAQQRLSTATARRNRAEREVVESIDLLGKESALERAKETVAETDARIDELEKEIASLLNILHGVADDQDWSLQAALVESFFPVS